MIQNDYVHEYCALSMRSNKSITICIHFVCAVFKNKYIFLGLYIELSQMHMYSSHMIPVSIYSSILWPR